MPAAFAAELRRAAYDRLRAGVPVVEVAAELGVASRLVYKWRDRVGGVLPGPPVISPRYLSREERYEIARLREAGWSMRAIARALTRAPSTISRELRRPCVRRSQRGHYAPEAAHSHALGRRRRRKVRKLTANERLRRWVQQRLDQGYSPEQITGRLPVEFPDDEQMRICHETIYRALYLRPRGELRRTLQARLRTGRGARHPRGRVSRLGSIQGGASIHDRPADIEQRLIPGDWEGDLIMGSMASKSAVATLVERRTGYLKLVALPGGYGADAVADALIAATATLPPVLAARTLTWDRGRELAGHRRIQDTTGIRVYFADPYSPWQRGSNENTNGLTREYLPKGSDLSIHTQHDLDQIADRLNNRPRKRHAFHTPNEVMTTLIQEDQQTRCCDVP